MFCTIRRMTGRSLFVECAVTRTFHPLIRTSFVNIQSKDVSRSEISLLRENLLGNAASEEVVTSIPLQYVVVAWNITPHSNIGQRCYVSAFCVVP